MAEVSSSEGSPSGSSSDDIDAFISAELTASADSSPAPTETPATAPAPATPAPDVSDSSAPRAPQGPIPFERHTAILDNARRKAREEADREYRTKYGWADRYTPEQVEQSSRLYQWLSENPKTFLQYLRTQVGEDVPASGGPARDEGPPPPDLRAEDGTPVYSAPQLQKLMEWKDRQYDERITPLQRRLDEQDRVAQMRQVATDAKAQATTLLTTARSSWPLFKDLQADVLAAMQANPSLSLHDAYITAFAEKGQKSLKDQWQAEYTGALAQKQHASTPTPGRPAGVSIDESRLDTRQLVELEFAKARQKR